MRAPSLRALSLWQPWASLIAAGAKRWETRSWPTAYRGPLLIHAAHTRPAGIDDWRFIEEAIQVLGTSEFDKLPRGGVVAIVELEACFRVATEATIGAANERDSLSLLWDTYPHDMNRARRELVFGDWSIGRYVWRFGQIRRLESPVVARGNRRLWIPPDDVCAAVAAARQVAV